MLSSPHLLLNGQHPEPIATFVPSEDPGLRDFLTEGTFVPGNLSHSRVVVSNDNDSDRMALASGAMSMLRTYWMHFPNQLRDGLLAQTGVVLAADEWEDEPCNASLDSYRTLLRSMAELKPTSRPNLALSDSGNFLAAWPKTQSNVVFEFLPNDRMKWMIAMEEGEESNRAAGLTNVSQITTLIEAHAGRAAVDG